MESAVYRYTVHIAPAEEGGFVVNVPAINGHTQAESYDEAVGRAEELVRFYIQSTRQAGEEIVEEFPIRNTIRLELAVPVAHE